MLKSPASSELPVLTTQHPELRRVRILDLNYSVEQTYSLDEVLRLEHLEELEVSASRGKLQSGCRGSWKCHEAEIKSSELTSLKIRVWKIKNQTLHRILNKQKNMRSIHLEGASVRHAHVEVISAVSSGLVELNLSCNRGKICSY